MLRRRTIGSATTESPAKIVGKFFSSLLIKLSFCALLSVAVYFFFTYFLFNFINFLIENITLGTPIDKNNIYFFVSMILAIIFANYITLKDWLRKR